MRPIFVVVSIALLAACDSSPPRVPTQGEPPAVSSAPACPNRETLLGGYVTPTIRRVPEEYPTLQDAVDASVFGDVVLVAPGVYEERVRLKSGIQLVGAGPSRTILDGRGRGESLVDYTGARDVVVSGFTLRNVGRATGCADSFDPFLCSGAWYAAAVYGDGHDPAGGCPSASIRLVGNVLRDNFIALLAYHHADVEVDGNVFVDNDYGALTNHFGGGTASFVRNLFLRNRVLAVASHAAFADIVGNVVAGSSVGVRWTWVQTGRYLCNVLAGNSQDEDLGQGGGDRFGPRSGFDTNVHLDALPDGDPWSACGADLPPLCAALLRADAGDRGEDLSAVR